MKKWMFILSVIVVLILLNGCKTEKISDEDLNTEMEKLSEQDLNLIVEESAAQEKQSLSGQAVRIDKKLAVGSIKNVPLYQATNAAKKVLEEKYSVNLVNNPGENSVYCLDDGYDDDGDKMIDCADPSCDGSLGSKAKKSGPGCKIPSLIPKAQLDGGYCPCEYKTEKTCHDGFDNDADGLTDCDDPDCAKCKTGNTCPGCFTKTLENCGDITDNDADGLWDCHDPDCWDKSCGKGCICKKTFFGGEKRETICNDEKDNELDGSIDCDDAEDCEDFLPYCEKVEISISIENVVE